ncbi:MAG: S8 family serine peptidase, partial [Haloarculaceae archaeon]
IDNVVDDTTGHGSIVTAILLAASYNIEFNFYRVTQSNGLIQQRHLQNAIGMAHIEHDIDVINLSIGTDHSDNGSTDCSRNRTPCKISEAALKCIDDGITIVAAGGNRQQLDSLSCPASVDEVICVGGYIPKCSARLTINGPLSVGGKYRKPPNACWINRPDDIGTDEVLCSGQDCSPMHSCNGNRKDVEWEGTIASTGTKPDILAPCAIPVIVGVPQISIGTSWATPFVTATTAEIVARVRDHGTDTSPQTLRQGIIEGAVPLDNGTRKLFHSVNSWYYVFDSLGLPRPGFSSNTDLYSL